MIRWLLRKWTSKQPRIEHKRTDPDEANRAEKMNARLLAITESAHDMIATFDLRGRILYLNRAGYAFLGILELNERHSHLERFMSVPATLRLVDGLRIARVQGYWQDESEWVAVDGTIRTASQTVVSHIAEGGDEPYFSTIVRDITERKQFERELLQAKQAADDANDAKSAFLARVTHEIRTPLNGIIGLTHLLQRSEINGGQRDYLRQIAESSNSLLYILNDLLDYSKLEADKLTIENVPFRLEDSLERLSWIFAVLLGPKAVDLIIRTEPGVPDVLYGDHARLEQVLLNLINNAIKFTDQGCITLHISVVERQDTTSTIEFTVTDTGIGMTPEQLEGLFQPFVQADEATSRTYGGTGLGLVISRNLVVRMGGSGIQAESRYRDGSRFQFRLPFNAHDSVRKSEPSAAGMRVLVLEDSARMREFWSQSLAELGCTVGLAAGWNETERLLSEGSWDVWITDMESGDMNGEETWRSWKKHADLNGVPVICFTTLHGRDALNVLPEEAKPVGVLVKPVVRQQMLHALMNLQNNRSVPGICAVAVARTGQTIAPASPVLQGTVLIVEDNEINRVVARELLEDCGLQTVEAGHGGEALLWMEHNACGLILMDLQMPVMDGIETTRRIRNDGRWDDLPIIAMTAGILEECRAECMEAGMNAVLPKPVNPETLYAVLSQWLPASAAPATVSGHTEEIDWPDTEHLDIHLALHRLDGKTALYLQLLERFAKEYADLPSQFRNLPAGKDTNGQERLLHSFRGAAAHLGAIPVAREARLLEETLRHGTPSEEHLAALERQLGSLIHTIEEIMRIKRH